MDTLRQTFSECILMNVPIPETAMEEQRLAARILQGAHIALMASAAVTKIVSMMQTQQEAADKILDAQDEDEPGNTTQAAIAKRLSFDDAVNEGTWNPSPQLTKCILACPAMCSARMQFEFEL